MRVVIVGSGLIGVSSAYFLAQGGAQVTVLERESGPARGTSYANSGMLTPSMSDPWRAPDHGATAANLRLARYSLRVLRELSDELGLSYDQRAAGSLRLLRGDAPLPPRWAALAACGLAPRRLSPAQAVALEPALADVQHTITAALFCEEDESGDAHRFTEALTRAAQDLGVRFRFGVEVFGFEHQGQRLAGVVTDEGKVPADAVVLAAGAWTAQLLQGLGLNLPLEPVKGYSITLDASGWALAPQRPVIDDTLHLAITPLGRRLRVAGLAECAGYDRAARPEQIEQLFALLLAVYPSFAPQLDRARAQPWAGLRPMTIDGLPFIGRLRHENLFVNTGHGHLGWTLAAGSARLLADLLADRAPALDAAAYDPRRVA